MAVNKVSYSGAVLIDLTSDTVTADKLLSGYTAHNAAGQEITGSLTQVTYYSGSSDPDKLIGSDGDLYFKL